MRFSEESCKHVPAQIRGHMAARIVAHPVLQIRVQVPLIQLLVSRFAVIVGSCNSMAARVFGSGEAL
ncbi:hypothetical protein D9M69_697970 [compost metagenome]